MLPIYYINLANRTDRRAQMEAQFDLLGLGATRIEAVNPLDMVGRLSHRGWFRNHFPGLSPEALASLLSHAIVLDYIAAGSEPWSLVLEDDAVLSRDLPDFLIRAEAELPAGLDLVRLEAGYRPARLGRENVVKRGPVAIRPLQSAQEGAGAYLIRPHAARRLLKALPKTGLTLEDCLFGRAGWGLYALSIGQTVPALSIQLNKSPRDRAHPAARADMSPNRPVPTRGFRRALRRQARALALFARDWQHFGSPVLWDEKAEIGFADFRLAPVRPAGA